jgi:tRNA A37 threonylcarbamoyltransferase TsaD
MTAKEAISKAQKLSKKFGWDPEHGGVVPQIALLIMLEQLANIIQEVRGSSRISYKRLTQS